MFNLIISRCESNFFACRNGAVAIILALIFPVLLGFTGLGFDFGWWYFTKRNFQGAADAAAASAAVAYSAGNTAGYTIEARAIAAQHGAVNGQSGVSVNVYYPLKSDPNISTSDPYYNNSDTIEVVISQTQPAMLAKVVGQGNVTIKARAVALISQATYCMLALDRGNVTGINLTLLISAVNFNNCSIGVNSSGSTAFLLQGILAELSAYTATVAGSIDNSCFFGLCALNWTHPAKSNVGAPYTPIADPYASVAVPTGNPPSTLSITSQSPCSGGGTYSYSSQSHTLPAAACYQQITVGGTANVTVPAGSNIGVNGINVSGGTLTLNTANYKIVGGSGKPGISVSGGTMTLNAGSGTNYIQGGSSNPGISVSNGTLTINGSGGTTDILGGFGNPAVNVTGGTVTMAGTPGSTNNILGASGQSAITVSGSSSTSGTFILGDGNSNIQAGSSSVSAIKLTASGNSGGGNFTTLDNTSTTGVVIGPPTPSTYGINVTTKNAVCGLLSNCGHDLTLGAGTYTIMGGIEVTGGNLTLNPTGTNIGTYVIDGGGGSCNGSGSNVGLCMTFGDLNAQNATIVLTGTGSNYATAYTQGADGINLTAPQTGATPGLAIFQDRNAPSTGSNTVVGIDFLTVTGALYFPAQALNFLGITAVSDPEQPANGNDCLQLIAYTITIEGLAWINDTCPAGVSPIVGTTSGTGSIIE